MITRLEKLYSNLNIILGKKRKLKPFCYKSKKRMIVRVRIEDGQSILDPNIEPDDAYSQKK